MAESRCACPGCSCEVTDASHSRNGQQFCSEACAHRHLNGESCPSSTCHCESGVRQPMGVP